MPGPDALDRSRLGGALHPADVFGLRPLRPALDDLRTVFAGDPSTPPNRWGPSSLRIFKPSIGLPTWLGRRRADRRVPIYNFFNRVPAPPDEGYSTRVTYARDFLGGRYTYDGHLGTDFAVPVGTPVVAAAPGRVLRVAIDLDMGGRKVCIDHGGGLFTTSNHLARALVAVGDTVARGQPVGLSGASGLEFVLCFPWVAPHLHFNVWLDGVPVDPFALPGSDERPLWRAGTHPEPDPGSGERDFEPTRFDLDAVDEVTRSCTQPRVRAAIEAHDDAAARAAEILVQRNYRPTRFASKRSLYADPHPREPLLDLPFHHTDFVGVAYPGYP